MTSLSLHRPSVSLRSLALILLLGAALPLLVVQAGTPGASAFGAGPLPHDDWHGNVRRSHPSHRP